ncbi:glycoside hydrolase [Lipomyces kononenkoae]|uniref:Glycoside hydrolase n=1 Tax=Lipomyces kononenkoae TaxID=34357 RepID=A0ACC3SZV3_LIPKO
MGRVAPKPRHRSWLFRIRRSYRRKYILLALVIVLILRTIFYAFRPTHSKIQFQFSVPHSAQHSTSPDLNLARAEAVRAEFKWAVKRYKDMAWGKDEVLPVTGGFQTTRNGFAATLIDSLTTAMVMNLTTEVVQALDYIVNTLDFDKHDRTLVDPFETTIRYLGSLVSAVDILDAGSLVGPIPRQSQYRDDILHKAIKLAEKLAPAFDSPLGIPWPRVNFTAHLGSHEPDSHGDVHVSRDISFAVTPARAGSNWLEYYRLTQHSMDPVYVHNATRAWASLVWNRNEETFDGLIDSPMDSFSGYSLGHTVSLGAGHDSYYEYLIKAAILAPRDKHASRYRKRWEQAMTSTMERLAFKGTPPDSYRSDGKRSDSGYLFIAQYFDGTYMNEMGHLTCYIAGNLILGGRYLQRNDLVAFGLEVLETCHATYVTATGLGPESFVWEPPRRGPASGQQVLDGGYEQVRWAISTPGPHEHEQVHKLGFWVSDARYFLRPEVIEGYFYAYRVTGDPKYQDWAWSAFEGLRKFSKAKYGYGEIQDVTLPDGGGATVDSSESFFLAETLKYLFLIFDDPERLSLDEWVLSTEAHPFRIE